MEATQIKMIDIKTATKYVSAIVSLHYGSNIISVMYLGGGSFGMAYKVEQDKLPQKMVVKVYKVDNMHRKEAYDLDILGEHTTMKGVFYL